MISSRLREAEMTWNHDRSSLRTLEEWLSHASLLLDWKCSLINFRLWHNQIHKERWMFNFFILLLVTLEDISLYKYKQMLIMKGKYYSKKYSIVLQSAGGFLGLDLNAHKFVYKILCRHFISTYRTLNLNWRRRGASNLITLA